MEMTCCVFFEGETLSLWELGYIAGFDSCRSIFLIEVLTHSSGANEKQAAWEVEKEKPQGMKLSGVRAGPRESASPEDHRRCEKIYNCNHSLVESNA